MKKLLSLILMITCIITLFGCNNQNTQINQHAMTIKPSEFSQETLDVLKLFDDEIQFFDIQLDDTAKSFSISIWQYQDEQWSEIGTTSGQAEFLGNRIAIRLDETTYEIYHMDENGHSSIKSPALDLKFEDTMAKIQWKIDQEEILKINEEKIIYAKVGTNKNEFSTSIISTDFREIECDAGIAITLTIFDKELND